MRGIGAAELTSHLLKVRSLHNEGKHEEAETLQKEFEAIHAEEVKLPEGPRPFPPAKTYSAARIAAFENESEFTNKIILNEELAAETKVRAMLVRAQQNFEEGNTRAARHMLGEYFLAQHKFRHNQAGTFIYGDGVYHPHAEEEIAKFVESAGIGKHASINVVREVTAKIQRATYIPISTREDPYLQCLANGVLNVKTGELSELSPEYFFLYRMPVLHNPRQECPLFKKFLEEVILPKDIPIIQELFGYCLLRDMPIQKAFLFVGAGANGKSTLINVLKAFLGQDNVTGLPLQKLEEDRFSAAQLYGKLANVYADLPSQALMKTAVFKMLTGGDLITAEKKGQDPFEFVNYAKMIFSANQVPETHDEADAFFRRWVIIPFARQFMEGSADKNLTAKLTSPAELSGILNWALEGLTRLLAAGELSNPETTQEVRRIYQHMSSPVAAFVDDCLEIGAEYTVEKEQLYGYFMAYCKRNKFPGMISVDAFGRKMMQELGHMLRTVQKMVEGGKRARFWEGIRYVVTDDVFLRERVRARGLSGFLPDQYTNNPSRDGQYTNNPSNQEKTHEEHLYPHSPPQNENVERSGASVALSVFAQKFQASVEKGIPEVTLRKDTLQNVFRAIELHFSEEKGGADTITVIQESRCSDSDIEFMLSRGYIFEPTAGFIRRLE